MSSAQYWHLAAKELVATRILVSSNNIQPPALLTREGVWHVLELGKWNIELASKVMAGLNPFFESSTYLPYFDNDCDRAKNISKKIKNLLLAAVEIRVNERADSTWIPVRFMGEIGAAELLPGIQRTGEPVKVADVDVSNLQFSIKSYFLFAKKYLLPNDLDCPVFGLFHDRTKEACAMFNSEKPLVILEPMEPWVAQGLVNFGKIAPEEVKSVFSGEVSNLENETAAIPSDFLDENQIATEFAFQEEVKRQIREREEFLDKLTLGVPVTGIRLGALMPSEKREQTALPKEALGPIAAIERLDSEASTESFSRRNPRNAGRKPLSEEEKARRSAVVKEVLNKMASANTDLFIAKVCDQAKLGRDAAIKAIKEATGHPPHKALTEALKNKKVCGN